MAKFGTAYIDIKPNLDAFGAGLGKKIEAQLAGVTPDLKQHIEVDVDRDTLARAGATLTKEAGEIGASISSSIGDAFRGIAGAAGGFLGVGGAFTNLGAAAAAAAPLVLGLALAIGVLVSSFAAAVAGAAALGSALAGALGPVALVAFAAIAKVVQIIKAIHDDGKGAADATQGIANAQDQVKAATDGVASAQTNLQQQTAAAYRAWQDSIEAVKDDLLGVQDAQLGIADANLSLREAQQALKEFKNEAPGLQGLFKKFTDVNVDTSGLKDALAQARKASGGKLSEDDSLKLERLILNVRRAKLQEKHATDSLHDANVQLQRDRKTEAGYIKKGIAAYPGYTSAVQGLAGAQRQLASAQRASAAATTKQAGALAKLSPLERNLAKTFTLISDAVKKAFGPAINGVLRGLNRALGIFVGVLKDPKVVRALKTIGSAIGGVFVTLAKTFSSKQFRDAFVTLAKGGARLVKILGGKAFPAFARILTSIAVAALPALVKLLGSLGDTLDRWARWIAKHPKEFQKKIDDLVNTFKGWLGVIIDVTGFLLNLGGKLKSLGDTFGRVFRQIKGGTGAGGLARTFGFDSRDIDSLGRAFHNLGKIAKPIIASLNTVLDGLRGSVKGLVQFVAGLISGDWAEAWRGFKNIVRGGLKAARGVMDLFLAPFKTAGRLLGKAFAGAFSAAFGAIKSIAKKVVSGVVSIINKAIDAINAVIGAIPNVNIPGLGHTRPGKIGHVGDPFKKKAKPTTTTLRPPSGHSREPRFAPTAAPRVATAGDSAVPRSTVVENVNISAPAAAVPDPRHAAILFSREIAKRA